MAAQDSHNIHFAENIDQAIIEQVRDIEKEVAVAFPLVSSKEDITVLSKDYANDDSVYQSKLTDLYKRYSHVRKTRGDGNCFYRGFGFRILELCLADINLLERVSVKAASTKDNLVQLGYPDYTVTDFYETFADVLKIAKEGQNLEEIYQIYNDQAYSDYVVVFLRLMVSCYLQENETFYSAFIEGFGSMKDFCSHEVEPMARESDHIHIIALSNVLNTTIQIEYMDRGGNEGACNHHRFPDDGSKPSIHLLYRPGHYDILYTQNKDDHETIKTEEDSKR